MPDDTMGDLARQDLYPDERLMQPPVNPVDLPPEAYASLGGGDLGLLGNKGLAGLFGGPSWLQKAQDVGQKDIANYQTGGVPAVIGSLADTSDAQDLAGGFGGNIKGVKAPVVPGALAAMTDYHPPFYSAVERAVQDAKQNTAPGQQWAGYLRNQPGVKPEEVETLGLGKLFEQPTVSKDALLGEIAANKVNVGEVVKGAPHYSQEMQDFLTTQQNSNVAPRPAPTTPDQWQALSDRLMWMGQNRQPLGDTAGAQRFFSLSEEAGRYAEGVNPSTGSTAGMPKFSQWTLPGGENYREMLLTLPTPNDNYIAAVDKMKAKYGDKPLGQMPMTDAERAYIDNQINAYGDTGGAFKSSHFDEPNILAHIRTNDRVIDGKKTLFVEEVQSDWHQKGKREGYRASPEEQAQLQKQLEDIYAERARLVGSREPVERAQYEELARAEGELTDRYNRVVHDGVPDAPFKTTWPDLAMKRVIREAAEKGYDKVAWTPGSVQAARYPDQLRQHVDNISWSSPGTPRSNPEGLRYVHATPRAGGMDLVFTVNKDGHITEASANQAKGQHVEDIFGKDMARQIMEKGEGEIASKDFVIGAKGMEGFYDQILPATVNKLVKKHGARVQSGELSSPRESFEPGSARAGLGDIKLPTTPVHTLDITPQLRAAAMKGFPLFTAGGVAATGMMGDLAKQDDYQ